jgi:methylated-DNA-[protein]-cysteine S-methyltransferase
MSSIVYTTFPTPLGTLTAIGDGTTLRGLYMQTGRPPRLPAGAQASTDCFEAVRLQLAEYFAGERTVFDLPVALAGTSMQLRVWRALQEIRYGETTTYGELARQIGFPSAPRAVGAINGQNPICVIVPCHRVIGADGSLTGYGGGLERKRLLLDLEAGQLALGVGYQGPD